MKILLPLLASACLCLGACATTEDVVSVSHTASAAQPVAGAAEIKVTVAATDARTTNRGRISTKVNGYGMEMAAIRSKEEVADVVKAALADEMKAHGYRLEGGGPTVSAAVETFYSSFKVGLVAGTAAADVAMTVTVTGTDGAVLYTRRIEAKGEKRNIQLASGGNAAAALSDGLDHALSTLFADPAFAAALKGKAGAAATAAR